MAEGWPPNDHQWQDNVASVNRATTPKLWEGEGVVMLGLMWPT